MLVELVQPLPSSRGVGPMMHVVSLDLLFVQLLTDVFQYLTVSGIDLQMVGSI